MEIFDDVGYVLQKKPYTEKGGCVFVVTKYHGFFQAFVYKRNFTQIHIMDYIQCHYQARLMDQLGTLKLEQQYSLPYVTYTDKLRLFAIESLVELLTKLLAYHLPVESVFIQVQKFMHALEDKGYNWVISYAWLELVLLKESGFALQTDRCIVTGEKENLWYISPKSGSVVTKKVGLPYHERLLLLPTFMKNTFDSSISFSSSIKDLILEMNIFSYFIKKLYTHIQFTQRMKFYKQLQIYLEKN